MEKLLEQLADILEKECDLHQDLLKTADALNEALKAQNLESIQTCTSIHDEQVYQITKLEEKRIDCASEIADVLKIKEENPKLDSLLQKVPQQWRARLSALQLKLKEQIKELFKINTSNRILLQEGISFINSSMKMFRSSPRTYQYGGKGKSAAFAASCSLINKVV
jgi:flagellar biosynthesis/type III secretory pathway chaperone